MISFEDFQPGHSFGRAAVTLDDDLMEKWFSLFPADAECAPFMPEGMTAVLVMNSYMELVSPRPPGNIHASQRFTTRSFPKISDTVFTQIACGGKTLKNGRRWVDLETQSTSEDGRLFFTGTMRTIWAA